MIHDGIRGFESATQMSNDNIDNASTYGVDWETIKVSDLGDLDEGDTDDKQSNPFDTRPKEFTDVPCHPPNCPFTIEQLTYLDRELQSKVDVASRSMFIR